MTDTPEYQDPPPEGPSKEEIEEMFRNGQLKRGPKLRIYGIVYDEFKPSFSGPIKNYLTEIRIYEIINEGKSMGFYAQAIMTTCERTSSGMEPVDTMHAIKIDLENEQFIAIEKIDGTKMEHNLKDRLQVENIAKMIDLTIAKITQTPEQEIQFVELGENAQYDSDEFWKQGGMRSSTWWKEGIKPEDFDLPPKPSNEQLPKGKGKLSKEDYGQIPDSI
jgi:hypothetical protein